MSGLKPLDDLYTDNKGRDDDFALADEASGLGSLKPVMLVSEISSRRQDKTFPLA